MKHVLCIYLRQWPIDRLRRRHSGLRHKPLVLFETIGNRQLVTHISPETPRSVRVGMTLPQARAHHAALISLAITPADDLRSLEALGRWLMRFSPSISIAPPSSIFLDAGGLQRIFGGLHNLRLRVADALSALRITADVAIAPTPGAAWALAGFGHNQPRVVGQDELPDILHPLPPQALRLDPITLELLHTLGIHTIGDLLKIHRDDLAVRFGPAILQRIDQATGAVHEPLVFLEHHSPIQASLEFDGAVESLDVIHVALQQLLARTIEQLSRRGLGARELRILFHRPYAPPIEKMVRLMRSSRNEARIFNLLRCAVETLETDDGFISIHLSIPRSEPLGDDQPALLGGEQQRNAAELDDLITRLRTRLGDGVEWAELVESHLPERAFRCRDTVSDSVAAVSTVAVYHPLCLLPQPRAIRVIVMPTQSPEGQPISFTDDDEVHRLSHVKGPERITGQWWNSRWKTRDYFDALDEMGNRYWLFRVAQTGRWFLHGIFE